jgi:hypothetical protein
MERRRAWIRPALVRAVTTWVGTVVLTILAASMYGNEPPACRGCGRRPPMPFPQVAPWAGAVVAALVMAAALGLVILTASRRGRARDVRASLVSPHQWRFRPF